MKSKLSLSVFFLAFTTMLFAAIPVKEKAPEMPYYLKVENFVKYTPSQFETLSGKKLSFTQKMFFKKLQRKLSKSNYTSQDNIMTYYDVQKQKFKLDPVWFVIGVIVGPFAILFSHTIHNSTRNKRISALIGFGVFFIWFGWLFLF